MISESYFNNLTTLRKAALSGDLALISARIAATKKPVAMVAAMVPRGGEVEVVPFGYLDVVDAINSDAQISSDARAEFNLLLKRLKSSTDQAQFGEDIDGRVRVDFTKNGVQPKHPDHLGNLVLAWANPYELFEDPTQ